MVRYWYVLVLLLLPVLGHGQSSSGYLERTEKALKGSDYKALSLESAAMIELGLPGQNRTTYSQTQAEFVLKEFFKKTPSTGFRYLHRVLDREDLKFAVGEYSYTGGTYRVTLVYKPQSGAYKLVSIVFERQ
jgi:hypothetical protein